MGGCFDLVIVFIDDFKLWVVLVAGALAILIHELEHRLVILPERHVSLLPVSVRSCSP
jgi:hypothetical protein